MSPDEVFEGLLVVGNWMVCEEITAPVEKLNFDKVAVAAVLL